MRYNKDGKKKDRAERDREKESEKLKTLAKKYSKML